MISERKPVASSHFDVLLSCALSRISFFILLEDVCGCRGNRQGAESGTAFWAEELIRRRPASAHSLLVSPESESGFDSRTQRPFWETHECSRFHSTPLPGLRFRANSTPKADAAKGNLASDDHGHDCFPQFDSDGLKAAHPAGAEWIRSEGT
jgi:hypothetical protein